MLQSIKHLRYSHSELCCLCTGKGGLDSFRPAHSPALKGEPRRCLLHTRPRRRSLRGRFLSSVLLSHGCLFQGVRPVLCLLLHSEGGEKTGPCPSPVGKEWNSVDICLLASLFALSWIHLEMLLRSWWVLRTGMADIGEWFFNLFSFIRKLPKYL